MFVPGQQSSCGGRTDAGFAFHHPGQGAEAQEEPFEPGPLADSQPHPQAAIAEFLGSLVGILVAHPTGAGLEIEHDQGVVRTR